MSSVRSIATVLFTDIVGSTERAMALGDRRWRELLGRHHGVVRERIARYGGQEIGTAGDGFLALFDAPTAALLCAASIRDALRALDLEIRAGVHMGEVERGDKDASGVSVHIGSRVAAIAEPGEILVSSTVRDAQAGSDFTFEDRGRHPLKGVPGEWRIYALSGLPDDADALLGPRQHPVGLAERLPRGGPALAAGIAAVLLLAAGIGYLVLRGDGPLPEPAIAGAAGPGIAILPFDVRGAEHGSMREGMVDLLSTNLDGAGGLRAIDSRTVLAEWRERVSGEETPALAIALQVAAATGARYAIVGNVVPIGDDMRVLADVHDLESGESLGRDQVEGSPDSIFRLVDDLSIALLRRLLQDEAALPRVNLASITTHSVPALKAFLEGEALYRRSDFQRAIPAYETAIEADSTFALAYSRMSEAYGWVERGGGPRTLEYLDLAERFAGRLPAREADLLRIRLAFSRNARDATVLARAGTEKYPDDPEAWNLLGEVYHHLGFQSLASRAEIDDAFRRATRLDPAYGPAYIHPLDHAFFLAESAPAAQLLSVLENLGADSDYLDRYKLSFAIAFGGPAARDSALGALATTPAVDVGTVGRNLAHPRLLDLQARLGEVALRNPAVPPAQVRARTLQTLLAQGRIKEAVRVLERDEVDPDIWFDTIEHAYSFDVPLPDSLYAQALAWQPADTVPSERVWFGALYALEHDRLDEYRRVGDILTRQIARSEASGDSTLARLVRLGGAALEGRELMLRGEDEAARRMLEPAYAEAGPPPIALWMAEILDRQGEEETAIRYLETFGPDPYVALRLAPLYEETGDVEKAREAYSWIVLAWDRADPVLMADWQAARSKLAGLGGLRRE
jgi:class 3 adenylate cyclase/tetratricopeptide (TPR) repeat protein